MHLELHHNEQSEYCNVQRKNKYFPAEKIKILKGIEPEKNRMPSSPNE
jgi:hypothetical protein